MCKKVKGMKLSQSVFSTLFTITNFPKRDHKNNIYRAKYIQFLNRKFTSVAKRYRYLKHLISMQLLN